MALRDSDQIHVVDSPHSFTISWADLKAQLASELAAEGVVVDGGSSGDISGYFGAVESASATISLGDFTDGGGASGTCETDIVLPTGAILLGSKVVVSVGFTGDTSAVFTIGDGSDEDRYMTGAPDCFTVAANGVETGPPSGARLVIAGGTVVVTVTSEADFGLVEAGTMTVTILYVRTV